MFSLFCFLFPLKSSFGKSMSLFLKVSRYLDFPSSLSTSKYLWYTPYLSTFVLIENTEKVVDVFSVARVLSISSRLFLCWKSVYCASPKCSRRGYMCAVKQEDIIWECLVLSTLPPRAENDGRHGACLLLWVLPDTTCIRRMSSFIQFSLLFCQLEKVKKTT